MSITVAPQQTILTGFATRPTPLPLSAPEIKAKIAGITAEQIELISYALIQQIMAHLGPVGKADVAQNVKKAKGAEIGPMDLNTHMALLHAHLAIERRQVPFFSKPQALRFMVEALLPVKEALVQAFSMPEHFLEDGMSFTLSDYHPEGIVEEAALKAGIEIPISDIPPKYYIELSLAGSPTRETGELVFLLTQMSDGVVFSKTTFTIAGLVDDMHVQLRRSFGAKL